MEDKGCASNKRDDSDRPALGRSCFKTPPAYNKIKRKIASGSDTAPLLAQLRQDRANSADIADFCRRLLLHKDLSSFKTVHFFKHEKGQSFALKSEIDRNTESQKNFHVNEFNQLFQAIKKSKNRAYGQETLKGFNFDILGTFLAREFSLENHNVIVIFSRNDFLTQTKEEKEAFNKLMKAVAPYINLVLDRELEAQQRKRYRLARENLPCSILVSERKEAGYKRLPSGKWFKAELDQAVDRADIFHQERIALLGELLNTLKHELSNPLFGLQLSAELLAQEFEGENGELMAEIGSSIKRSQSIISNFTELYTTSESISAKELEKMVNEIFTLTKSQSRSIEKNYKAEGDSSGDYVIQANSVWLAQILFNLVVNSAQALNNAKSPTPRIEVKALLKSPFELHVIDNGPGIDPETLENMFQPFYTTKAKGTGLGLAISQNLASKLKGSLSYKEGGQGAHFVLQLRA